MKNSFVRQNAILLALLVVAGAVTQLAAQAPRRGLFGDWNIKTQFGDREFESILAFSRDREGNPIGAWISFFGMTELKDVRFEDNQLSYTQTFQGRDGAMTSKFQGALEDGKLNGTLSGDRGESKVVGERAPRMSRAVGDWAMKIKAGDREYTGTLTIKQNSAGDLEGEWKSERVESTITDFAYNRGELSFQRTMKLQDNEWASTFQGNVRGNELTGVFKSDRGEAETVGERIGASAIGAWKLTLESDRGPRQQRLLINRDMSGLYGSMAVDRVNLEGNELSFKTSMQFGDREFTTNFAGKIDGDRLTGELTTGQGTREVTGEKLISNFRRGR